MSIPQTSFKKKPIFDFSNNAMMTSSVRNTGSSYTDENYLTMEKQLKKVKKNYNDLNEKYNKMKELSIGQKVELDMQLNEANNKIHHLNEQNLMLATRIQYLESQATSTVKNYQRPLNRSINKSVNLMKKSKVPTQNRLNISALNLHSDRSTPSQRSTQKRIKTQRSNPDEFENPNDQSLFTQEDTVYEIKFEKAMQKQKPLISEYNQSENNCAYCGNQRCISNYKQLQYLRNEVSNLSDQMEDIYLKLNFQLDKRNGLKQYTEYQTNLQKLCEQNQEFNFFYKGKPEFLINKLQQKVSQIIKGQDYNKINPLLSKLKEKMLILKKEKEELIEQTANQSYDYEKYQKEIEKYAKNQEEMFSKMKEKLQSSGKMNEKFTKIFENYEKFKQTEWKKIGLKY